MRIAELSRESGVPIPTIKYYLREGLLPPGERTSPNQARYDAKHLRRLRLIRAFIDIGGVPVSGVRALLDTIDAQGRDMFEALGHATLASLPEQDGTPPTLNQERAARELDAVMAELGWDADSERSRQVVVKALATLYDLGADDLAELLPVYAKSADVIGAFDLDLIRRRSDQDTIIEGAVIGTVLGEQIWAGLRHLAHEAHANRVQQPPVT